MQISSFTFTILLLGAAVFHCAAQDVENPYALAYSADGGTILCASATQGILRSTDKGSSWTDITNGIQQFRYIHLVAVSSGDNTHYFAGGALVSGEAALIESTDGGGSWSTVPAPQSTDWFNSMIPVPWRSGQMLLSDTSHAWKGTFPGPVWYRYPNPDSWQPVFIGVSVADSNRVYLSTEYHELSKPSIGRLYTSSDQGSTWNRVLDSIISPIHKLLIDPTDGDHVAIIADGILESYSAGLSWSSIPAPAGAFSATIGDHHWTSGRWYAAGWYGSVRTTSDHGRTWTRIAIDSGRFITDIVVDPRDACHAFLLRTDGLYETRDCGLTVQKSGTVSTVEVIDVVRQPACTIVSIAPNTVPWNDANRVLTVTLSHSTRGRAHISLHDLLGRERFRTGIEGGTAVFSLHLPTATLSRGWYFLQLQDGMSVSVEKLVIR